ncbi:hypothetical protein O3P69_001267 [Scylla paramamosain]|uniref:FAD dependent oxidoreductase domain-containing protein n=1 Tax=Scylla paramamosain TaxID=85552 RepID=A0AAW0URH6_SCYPA
MYLGLKVLQELQDSRVTARKSELQDLFQRCHNFMSVACCEIKKSWKDLLCEPWYHVEARYAARQSPAASAGEDHQFSAGISSYLHHLYGSGEVDVVVVGGGVLGCSSLYHLAKLGVTNTILLEAHELTAGTTWHTAGLMSTMGRSETDYSLRNTTLNMLRRLEEETGVSPGLIENGSVYISSTRKGQAVRKDEFARWVTFMRVLGCECELITLSQLKDLYPLVDTSDINAVVHVREGGQMDPAGTCEGLTRWAMKQGARVVKCCPVTDIRTTETLLGGRRVSEVHTNQGVIKTNAVINATGSWGNYITSMVGVTLPLQSFRHGYVVTEGVEGLLGMPVLRDLVSSAYLKAQGDSAVIGYFEPNPEPIDQIRRNFPFGLYEMNWDIYGPIHEQIIQRIPILENVGIKSTIVGPESFTPRWSGNYG